MRPSTLKILLQTTPFRAFEVHLTDGRSFVVSHPELVTLSTRLRVMLISLNPDDRNRFRRRDVVDLIHITGISLDVSRRQQQAGQPEG